MEAVSEGSEFHAVIALGGRRRRDIVMSGLNHRDNLLSGW